MSSNNLSLSDPRLEWLSERVCLALGITSEDFRYLLTEPYADRPQKERFMHDLDGPIYTLKKFFGDTVKPGGGIFFFPVLEEVEEEYQVGSCIYTPYYVRLALPYYIRPFAQSRHTMPFNLACPNSS